MADSTGPDRDGRSSPAEMEAPMDVATPTKTGINPQAVDHVMFSDVGINVLLQRLKQSIASAKEFADFLKKRSSLEDEHQKGLRKLSKLTFEASKNQEARTGSYALQLADVSRAQDRMAANGDQFAVSLQTMHDDLNELTVRMEKERKHWKQEGTSNEKKVKEAEAAMDKAKSRYYGLAEDYDRARTGDKGSGRVFTVKGPKSAEKHEEDLLRKLEQADRDYQTRVSAAQTQRQDNLTTLRPQAVKRLQDLIRECDAALVLQLQKFATFNEKLIFNNGQVVSPMKDEADSPTGGNLSMKDMVAQIDNERDFQTYVTSQTSTVPPKPAEIRYERHPTLAPPPSAAPASKPAVAAGPAPPVTQAHLTSTNSAQSSAPSTMRQPQPPSMREREPQLQQQPSRAQNLSSPIPDKAPQLPSPVPRQPSYGYQQSAPQPQQQQSMPYRGAAPQGQQYQAAAAAMQNGNYGQSYNKPPYPSQAAPLQAPAPVSQQQTYARNGTNGTYAPAERQYAPQPRSQAPPAKRVFGETLETLFKRDELPVPLVVSQCIQAVDLFGLQLEGIYRQNGNVNHINQLKQVFDSDAAKVDFRNPAHFHNDINSVAGLLKTFFRELPDPLLTSEFYSEFIEAARIEDDTVRRDSLHAVINSLPDPNYATLRALILHLYRVSELSNRNRMSTSNLAICFAPTVMGPHRGPHPADAGLQVRVVDTILQNTIVVASPGHGDGSAVTPPSSPPVPTNTTPQRFLNNTRNLFRSQSSLNLKTPSGAPPLSRNRTNLRAPLTDLNTLPDPRTSSPIDRHIRTPSTESGPFPDLSNEVAALSTKLIDAINHQTNLDDTLQATRHELVSAKQRIQELEAKVKGHEEQVSKGVWVRRTEADAAVARIRSSLAEEKQARSEAEKQKKGVEQEIENLTASLFEEANKMVATERQQNEQLRNQLRDSETIRTVLQEQLQDLKGVMEKLQEANDLHETVSATPVTPTIQTFDGAARPFDASERSPRTPSFQPVTADQPLKFGNLIRPALRDDLPAFEEFVTMIRSSRPGMARAGTSSFGGMSVMGALSNASTSSITTAGQAVPQTPTIPGSTTMTNPTSPSLGSLPGSFGPSSPSLNLDFAPTLEKSKFYKRVLAEDVEPTLRLDVAPGLSWLARRTVVNSMVAGTLVVEPWPSNSRFYRPADPCSLCGETRRTELHSRRHRFRTSENDDAQRYALCSYCLERVRATCELVGFLRLARSGHVKLESPEEARAAYEECTKLRERMFWAKIGGGVVPAAAPAAAVGSAQHAARPSLEVPLPRRSQDVARASRESSPEVEAGAMEPRDVTAGPAPPPPPPQLSVPIRQAQAQGQEAEERYNKENLPSPQAGAGEAPERFGTPSAEGIKVPGGFDETT